MLFLFINLSAEEGKGKERVNGVELLRVVGLQWEKSRKLEELTWNYVVELGGKGEEEGRPLGVIIECLLWQNESIV